LSVNGSTGAITNVARTNVDNNFNASQTINAFGAVFGIYDTLNSAGVTIDPLSNDIIWTNGLNQSTLDFNPQGQVVTLPNITTTLAGLSGTQTFGGTKTFNALTSFNAGISSSGGTFSALTRFTAGISAAGATFTGPVNLTNTLLINSSQGSNNQVLTSTGSGITWATPSGSGGISRLISTITTSTSAGSTANIDYVYNGNTSGNINLTLPTAVSNTNRYTVKNSNIGILTVLTTSSQTIDGITGYALSKQYQAIDLLSDNSNWFIV
jgi:hypothetical protein